jgi:hypothetical protein
MEITNSQKNWYVARWTPLAWLETLIKVAGQAFGIAALYRALTLGSFSLPAGRPLVQAVILLLLSLGLAAAIWNRIQDREIVAMVFVLINNLAHWGLLLALASTVSPGNLLVWFAALFLLGDIVKIIFIRVDRFTAGGYPQSVLYGLTSIYIAGYALLLILELLK